ncbi:MAG: glycoside hydrolase family 43 protein [Candidatus Sumerlaeota bacterium]
MAYKNPVIPGFHPDPRVCRVGEDFYLVTSSFEFFPGVPIFHSRDLVNWKQIGHCLTRKSQLPLDMCEASKGIWAPTIRHHKGRFYMTTTNTCFWKNFVVYADDPAGEWSEPVWNEQGGIDPSILFDDDGKAYFTTGGNRQSEMDPETCELITQPKKIWEGTGGGYLEAPHLYHIGEYYYLMAAEGGTSRGHMETIARSKDPWGPFEPCPHNPILSNRGNVTTPLQATGHGDLVQAEDGSWWMVFLAIRDVREAGGFPAVHLLGRETCLAPVEWTDDGWPVVNENGTVDIDMNVTTLPEHPFDPDPVRDDFDQGKLRPCWNFLRNPADRNWSLSERGGWLCLKGGAIRLDDTDSPAWVGRRQQHHHFAARTRMEFAPRDDGEEAGITIFMNEEHHYEIGVTRWEGERRLFVRRRVGDIQLIVFNKPLYDDFVELQIEGTPTHYIFSWKEDGQGWTEAARGMSRYISTEVAGGFTGPYIAMYASGNGKESFAPAWFDWFDYEARL